jgi:hypothetical protein
MIYVKSPHPPGTVAYISANNARYSDFYDGLEQLRVPNGTVLAKSVLYNAARNRNEVSHLALGEWILYLDDDHVWEPNLLLNLLDRNVDIVGPPYCRRYPPFESVAFSCYHPETLICEKKMEDHIWTLCAWDTLSEYNGLFEVQACGFGALLVRKRVLDKMRIDHGVPFFRVGDYDSTWLRSSTVRDELGEDLSFCWAARKSGFKVYWDLTQFLGHITETKLIATRDKSGKFRIISNVDGHCTWLS